MVALFMDGYLSWTRYMGTCVYGYGVGDLWNGMRLHGRSCRVEEGLKTGVLFQAYTQDLKRQWQPVNKDKVEFFYLRDLWEQYNEWSAYGAGVPIWLPDGKPVVQYYTPYLSAIQIYTTKAPTSPRLLGEETESSSSSDGSKSDKKSRSLEGVPKDSNVNYDGSWPTTEQIGHLYLQFSDSSNPYQRVPLLDKVCQLARSYPKLMTFTSAELSPASWMSVAWYPIYHIPSCGRVKELSACFLTYHTISSSFADHIPRYVKKGATSEAGTSRRISRKVSKYLSLEPFGLATYKMQGGLFAKPEAGDREKLSTLYGAADSWLKQLRFFHNDFDYFRTHCM